MSTAIAREEAQAMARRQSAERRSAAFDRAAARADAAFRLGPVPLEVGGKRIREHAIPDRTGGGPRVRPRPADPSVRAACDRSARKRRLEQIMTAALEGDSSRGKRGEKIPRDEGVT